MRLSSNSPITNGVGIPGRALVAVERGDLAVDKVPIDLAASCAGSCLRLMI
jgi:hypothetical protein